MLQEQPWLHHESGTHSPGKQGGQLAPSATPVLTHSRPVLVAQGIAKVLNA